MDTWGVLTVPAPVRDPRIRVCLGVGLLLNVAKVH